MSLADILLITALVALNAFFVAVEFAVAASRRARLDVEVDTQSRGAALLRRWLENDKAREKIIATTQFGTMAASLTLGLAGGSALSDWIAPVFAQMGSTESSGVLRGILSALPVITALAVLITVQVVLGDQVPKVAALQHPERFAAAAAPVMQVFVGIFRGFVFVLDGIARAILALFSISANGHAHTTTLSVEDLRQMVTGTEAAGMIEQPESQMLSAVIDFGSLVARQVSVPRTEMIAIQSTMPIDEAARVAMQHGVTKLPVYEESMDQIAGILHLKDLLPALLTDDRIKNRPAGELVREALFVPESIPVNDLLVQMRARRQHIAITLDEFGGTAGLVTLEDLLEEIVGDVRDPFDVHQPDIQPLSDGTALLDGMALIEEVNDAFGASLYDPDYDTIAGYVLGKLGRIAQIGDEVEDTENGFRLRVESMDRLRIARIHLSRISDNP